MTTDPVILRNDVLQYGMNHQKELDGALYLKKPFKHGTIEIYGCSIYGDILGVDRGEEVTVPYNELGPQEFKHVFQDLYKKYCSS